MALRPTIVPLRLSVDAHADRVVLVAYGAVAALWDDDPRLCVAPQLRFFTGADGLLTGFAIEPFTGFDADALVPSPWGEPRFAVPALGLARASVGEIVLAARARGTGNSTHDVDLVRAAERRLTRQPSAALLLLRRALEAGESGAHLGIAAAACCDQEFVVAYAHARAYTELAAGDPWGWTWRGRACEGRGDRAEAISCYRSAIAAERGTKRRTPAPTALATLERSQASDRGARPRHS